MTEFTRRQLGRRLKNLRGKRTLSEPVKAGIIGSTNTLMRLERGESVRVMYPVVVELATFFGAPAGLSEELGEMYRAAQSNRPWGDVYKGFLIHDFSLLLDLEVRASEISIYEPDMLPGLCQSEDYVRQLGRKNRLSDERMREWVGFHAARVAAFWGRKSVPRMRVLIGEWAMPHTPSDIAHLHGLPADVRALSILGVPYPQLRGPFTLMRFPEATQEPDCLYLEEIRKSQYREEPSDTNAYAGAFDDIWALGTPLKEL